MSVRQRLDELLTEPAVADLGYPADQRVVAAIVLGLQLLADAVDQIDERLRGGSPVDTPDTLDTTDTPADASPDEVALPVDIEGITAEIEGITAQVGTLAKLIKKAAEDK